MFSLNTYVNFASAVAVASAIEKIQSKPLVVLPIMASGRLSVIYLLISSFIVQFICVLAFRVYLPSCSTREFRRTHRAHFPAPLTNHYRLITPLSVLRYDKSSQVEGARSRRPSVHSRNCRQGRRQHTFIHEEFHTTAAGVESLFSLLWWPFAYERATKSSVVHDELYVNIAARGSYPP